MKNLNTATDQGEELLRQTQERLLTAQRIGKMGIWELDIASNALWWSDQVYAIFALSADKFALAYVNFVAHVHPDDSARFQIAQQRALSGQSRLDIEHRIITGAGETRWVHELGELQLDTSGKPAKLVGTVQDITGQKLVEASLANSRRTQTLLSRCNEALIRSESEGDLLARVCQIAVELGEFRLAWIGYASDDPEKLVVPQAQAGEGIGYLAKARITWAEDDPDGRGPAGRIIRGGQTIVVPDMERDTSFAPWLQAALRQGFRGVVGLPLKDSHKTFGLLVLYMPKARVPPEEEIKLLEELAENLAFGIGTFRARKERQIAYSLMREQASLLDRARDAILVRDPAHRVTYWNAGAERLYGWSRAEVLGRSVGEFLYRDTLVFDATMALLEQEGEWTGQLAQLHRDGSELIVESRWTLLRDDAGQPLSVLVINTDITERLALEERLRQSQRLESIGQLTGGVAHDFNNLLTVILGNAELLTAQSAPDSDQRAAAHLILEAAQRGADLTQRLLAFARKQALDPKTTDVNRLVANLERMLKRTLGEHIEIEIVAGTASWPALVDPVQLENALLNLCLNARDAMPKGGRLTIETCNAYIDDDYAKRHAEVRAGQYVMLTVSDTGTGIAPAHLARVFEPFFTTKEKGKGTGLGLAMVYGFVKQTGGHASIYSEPGHGTTVKLYLPPVVGPAPVTALSGGNEQMTGGSETILMVEDDEFVRRYAQGELRNLGYTVLAAENGMQALELLRAHVGIDLLFTDVVMPGMGGRELADQARQLRPGLRVLYTSGYTENAIVHNGRLDPGVLLLTKPYRRIELANKIREALAADSG
ncbi:PAS domain-containing protein [Lacisediminimonas sp.]|uniref:PAS domain-containing protein n=1 Tax=Lacisediminimonas sp. TaxID=3060582 RepID=UPI0027238E95|nr:PAS domain-containing protein [Lacisediminimonas sp.]MDO8298465.1 PAS domain-containing protein [Lacisediminimonas sp.]